MLDKSEQITFSIIGPGAVGTNLAQAMVEAGAELRQVVARNSDHTLKYVAKQTIADVKQLSQDVELILITTPDDAIAEVVVQLIPNRGRAVVAHTSGSTPLSALEALGPKVGVIYPLQTFSQGRILKLRDVPFFVEAVNGTAEQVTHYYASLCSPCVQFLDSDGRLKLHLGAVFAANFANFMAVCADDLALMIEKDFRVYIPLMREVMRKMDELSPLKAQTGPAFRHDRNTLERQEALLAAQKPELAELYRVVSAAIMARYPRG